MSFSSWVEAGRPKGSGLGDSGFVPITARPMQGQRAGLFTRLLAACIDVAAAALVTAGAWIGLFLLLWAVAPVTSPTMPNIVWFVVGGVLLLWLAWTVAYATNGRALGHQIMGIRVIGRKGAHMQWLFAAMRAALNIVFPLGIFWIIPSAQNRSVQDVLLRSNVIYSWVEATPNIREIV